MKKLMLLMCAVAMASACSKQTDKVVAKVGSDKIMESYLQEKLTEVGPGAAQYLATKPGRKQFLDVIIHERLMLIAARKSSTASNSDYKTQIAQKEAEMRSTLEAYKDYLLTRMWIQNMRDGELKVSDAEVKEYYQLHPDKVTLAHILMANNEEAEAVYRKLRAGADFDKMAKQVSLDHESSRLPPVMYGEFLPELEDMAFKMKVGETQGIVRTPLGFHIIKKLAQDRVPEAEAADRVRKILEKKKFDDYLGKLQDKMKVEVLDENYK